MHNLTPEQEKLLTQHDLEIRKKLEEKAIDLGKILKFLKLREPVKLQYMSHPVGAITVNPMSYGNLKVLGVPDKVLKETEEIKQVLLQKGIDTDQILTKMDLDPKTVTFRFAVADEHGFFCNHSKQMIIIDDYELERWTRDEIVAGIGHECAHLKYHQNDTEMMLQKPWIVPPVLWAGILGYYKLPHKFKQCSSLVTSLGELFIEACQKELVTLQRQSYQEEILADLESVSKLNCAKGAIASLERDIEENKQRSASDTKSQDGITPDGNDRADFFHPSLTARIAAIKGMPQQEQSSCS